MRTVEFKRAYNKAKGIKHLTITQASEDANSSTHVDKSFIYQAVVVDSASENVQAPQIHVKKFIDTKQQIEKFTFEVKGSFLVTHDRKYVKIKFHHRLHIEIRWKNKIFSPKKSAVLTK